MTKERLPHVTPATATPAPEPELQSVVTAGAELEIEYSGPPLFDAKETET